MKFFCITVIFWLSIWTAPRAFQDGRPLGWWLSLVVMLWGMWLTYKMLKSETLKN